MAYRVVDVNDCDGTVAWTQCFIPKSVSCIEIMRKLHSLSLLALSRLFQNLTKGSLSEVAMAPMLFICNQGTSPLNDLDFKWFRQMELTSSHRGKRRTQVSDLFGPKILEGHRV